LFFSPLGRKRGLPRRGEGGKGKGDVRAHSPCPLWGLFLPLAFAFLLHPPLPPYGGRGGWRRKAKAKGRKTKEGEAQRKEEKTTER